MATIKVYNLNYEGFLSEVEDQELGRVLGGRRNKQSNKITLKNVDQSNKNDDGDDVEQKNNISFDNVDQSNEIDD